MVYLMPPLRLILNTDCNGRCTFCHHEGYVLNGIMDAEMVYECAEIAQALSLPNLSLTGGKPTLRKDLPCLLNGIQHKYKGHISLTTNGFNLFFLYDKIDSPLNSINLSITSFNENIWKKYQNVNPYEAIKSLCIFPAANKNLNVLISKENYLEIEKFFECCIEHSLSLDLMFELTESNADTDNLIYQYIFEQFRRLGTPRIEYGITPMLIIDFNANCKFRIKHSSLSSLVKWQICQECKSLVSCYERICAIRIYPNGTVTPCLNNEVKMEQKNLSMLQRIQNAYNILGSYKIDKQSLSNLFV